VTATADHNDPNAYCPCCYRPYPSLYTFGTNTSGTTTTTTYLIGETGPEYPGNDA